MEFLSNPVTANVLPATPAASVDQRLAGEIAGAQISSVSVTPDGTRVPLPTSRNWDSDNDVAAYFGEAVMSLISARCIISETRATKDKQS